MILAGLFAGVMCLGLILGDWFYFVRLTPDASRYGCTVARSRDRFGDADAARLRVRFDVDGALTLPHGIARYDSELHHIAIRPQYHLFSMSFRTLWPLKGLIHLTPDEQAFSAVCIKRVPWSSALITLAWFLIVGVGTLSFMVDYAVQGGFGSLTGILMGAGIFGIGLLVFVFGLMTVVVSYRLENSRLTQVYSELKEVVEQTAPAARLTM